MISLFVLPLVFLTAPLTLDDGHQIKAPLIQGGQVSPDTGFLVSIGDIADIQATLNGNSSLVRIAEIKDRFEQEQRRSSERCNERLKNLISKLDESALLNERLKSKLEKEQVFSKRLIYGATITGFVLSGLSIYLYAKGGSQ